MINLPLRLTFICLKCGQANYDVYYDIKSVEKLHELESDGFNSQKTCINCRYVRK